jgi:transcription elongation factor Elf1
MFKRLGHIWRLLTNPAVPEPLPPGPLALDLVCRQCGQSFRQGVKRLYIDLNVSRQHMGQTRSLTPDEFSIPERIECPHCAAVDDYEVGVAIFGQLAGALLRSRLGAYHPDEPIQFINMGSK